MKGLNKTESGMFISCMISLLLKDPINISSLLSNRPVELGLERGPGGAQIGALDWIG